MTDFTAIEQATIRNAVTDQAGGYFGGPLHLGKADAARYVSEGHLGKLCDKYSLSEVWRAVAEVIAADESVLHRTHEQRTQGREEREARCERMAEEAFAAYQAGDLTAAAALIDEAELVDPSYRSGRSKQVYGYDWADIRAAITRRSEAHDTAV
jgi:hypothetical protein